MAIKFGYMPHEKFTKIDNQVARIKELPDASVRYYTFIAGLANGKTVTDEYVAKALGWSTSKVKRSRAPLTKYDLVLMETIHRGLHYIYIGSTDIGASMVRKHAILDENKLDDITLESLSRKQKRSTQ